MNPRRCKNCSCYLKKGSTYRTCGNCFPEFKVDNTCKICGDPISYRATKLSKMCGPCFIKQRKGVKHPRWKGGKARCPTCRKMRGDWESQRECQSCRLTGDGNTAWKGGRRTNDQGYVQVHAPDHPFRKGKRSKQMLEHRLVMEEKLGRYLLSHEIVHHLNGIRNDNRPENLVLTTRQQHESGTLLKLERIHVNKLEAEIKRLEKLLYDNNITL